VLGIGDHSRHPNEFHRADENFRIHTHRSLIAACQEGFRNGWIGEIIRPTCFYCRPTTAVVVEVRAFETIILPSPSSCCAGARLREDKLHRQTVVRFPSPAACPQSTMRCPTACRASCWTLCFLWASLLMVGTSTGEWRNSCLQPSNSSRLQPLRVPTSSQKGLLGGIFAKISLSPRPSALWPP
jgi:hypothetical protein